MLTKLEWYIIAAIISILVSFTYFNIVKSNKCRDTGGIWFVREAACLEVKVIK